MQVFIPVDDIQPIMGVRNHLLKNSALVSSNFNQIGHDKSFQSGTE